MKKYSLARISPRKKAEKVVYYFQAVPKNLYEDGSYVLCSCKKEYKVVAKNINTALKLTSNFLLENELMLLSQYWRFIGTDTVDSGVYKV